jgi:hypothetical protein
VHARHSLDAYEATVDLGLDLVLEVVRQGPADLGLDHRHDLRAGHADEALVDLAGVDLEADLLEELSRHLGGDDLRIDQHAVTVEDGQHQGLSGRRGGPRAGREAVGVADRARAGEREDGRATRRTPRNTGASRGSGSARGTASIATVHCPSGTSH